MLITTNDRSLRPALLSLICLLTLTGCPGSGDRLTPDEKATVIMMADNVCFEVPDAGDYQPADIAINPRGTPYKEQNIAFDPALRVTDGKLCISPSFYTFPDQRQFIVEYVLTSSQHPDKPRKMVAGLGILQGHIHSISLTDREILRQYSVTVKP